MFTVKKIDDHKVIIPNKDFFKVLLETYPFTELIKYRRRLHSFQFSHENRIDYANNQKNYLFIFENSSKTIFVSCYLCRMNVNSMTEAEWNEDTLEDSLEDREMIYDIYISSNLEFNMDDLEEEQERFLIKLGLYL